MLATKMAQPRCCWRHWAATKRQAFTWQRRAQMWRCAGRHPQLLCNAANQPSSLIQSAGSGACEAPALVAAAPRPSPPTAAAPAVQAEDKEGETPLGAAAAHGKLRDGLVAIAKGEQTLDDFMME